MTVAAIIAIIQADKVLKKLREKILSGKGTFKDTFEYNNRAAELLGANFSESVLAMSLDDRVTACVELLRDRYNDIIPLLDTVQKQADLKNKLHISPKHPPFNAERAEQIGTSLRDLSVSDERIQRRARSAPETATRAIHDDYIEANVELRSSAGIKCYITRTTDGNCCDWCTRVAGRYEYGTEPEDIFRRHDNCGCSVTYENGRERQDVWSKKTWTVPEDAGAPEPTRFTREQAASAGAEPPKVFTKDEARKLNDVKVKENTAKLPEDVHNSSIDKSVPSGIIRGRGSGNVNGSLIDEEHTFEKIGEIDFSDKEAIAKSLKEFEQKYKDSQIEHCRVFCPNGEVYEVHGDLNNVNTDLLGDKMIGSINEHNHVIGKGKYTFSLKDVINSADDGSYISMAYDEKYRYSMTFSDLKISEDSVYESYQRAKESVGDDLIFHPERIPIGDEEHERIKRTCEELGIKYSRVFR